MDRCSLCLGAVLRAGGQQGRHPLHLLQLLRGEEGLCVRACLWACMRVLGCSSLFLLFAFLIICHRHHSVQYLHAFVNEITILVPVLNDSKHTFAIYTPERTKQRWPIRLAAATEQEMHDWVCIFSSWRVFVPRQLPNVTVQLKNFQF